MQRGAGHYGLTHVVINGKPRVRVTDRGVYPGRVG